MDRDETADRRFFRWTELDRTSYPEFRDRILAFEGDHAPIRARTYAGVPREPLERVRPRALGSLDRALAGRRSARDLETGLPPRRTLSRILQFAHGVNESRARGPVPSGGGLQALELYLAVLGEGWPGAGLYHYDREAHALSRLGEAEPARSLPARIPSMAQFSGGSLLWVLAGDLPRVERKYGARAGRFLLLEAGHLMQNLCLLSASLGWCTLPLGGYFERDVARAFRLPAGDAVLYVGVLGRPRAE